MTAHDCRVFDPACYRCDLAADEVRIDPHPCDNGIVDRIACPEPCGSCHAYCSTCGDIQGTCPLDDL